MATYGRGSRLVDDEANMLRMRHDLHFIWDAHVFALVPKQDTFTVHVLTMPHNGIVEFAASWHNVPVRDETLQQSEAYIFANFAQAVFMLSKPFLVQSTTHRYVARLRVSPDDPRHGHEVKEEWLSGSSLCDLYGGGGSRSASPSRKRSHSQASADLVIGEEDEGSWDRRYVRKRRRGEAGDIDPERQGSSYERDVQSAFNASDSEDERQATWYRANVSAAGTWNSDSEDDCFGMVRPYKEPDRGRPRERRLRQQRQRSEHTVDTLPSLTDMSAVGLDDVQPSSEDLPVFLTPTGSNDQHEKDATNSKLAEVIQDPDPIR